MLYRRFKMQKKHDLIVSNPSIMMGKPVIKGTRITVETILERMSEGETIHQILEAYPHIKSEAIYECLAFAADALKADVIYPICEAEV